MQCKIKLKKSTYKKNGENIILMNHHPIAVGGQLFFSFFLYFYVCDCFAIVVVYSLVKNLCTFAFTRFVALANVWPKPPAQESNISHTDYWEKRTSSRRAASATNRLNAPWPRGGGGPATTTHTISYMYGIICMISYILLVYLV